jgi:hypothetical protein
MAGECDLMKRLAAPLFALGGLLLATPAPAANRAPMFALPSDIIALDIAFARAVREKGQYKAMREFAADDAQMFSPQGEPVRVQSWTRGQKEPGDGLQWKTHRVWMSCDGSAAVSYGGWSAGAAHGWYSTVWQRQKNGQYRFVLDQGAQTSEPLAEPEWLEASVADCPAKPSPATPKPQGVIDHLSGQSADGTLAWTTTLGATRSHSLRLKQGENLREVIALLAK